jgi:hypothetical protein
VRDWFAVITRINPLTCAVDLLRNLVFALRDMPAATAARFATGVSCSDTHCRLPWNWASLPFRRSTPHARSHRLRGARIEQAPFIRGHPQQQGVAESVGMPVLFERSASGLQRRHLLTLARFVRLHGRYRFPSRS